MDNAASWPRDEELLQHTRWMGLLARHLVADSHTADDVVQDAWLAAGKHAEPGTPWLRGVVRNLAKLSHRQRARRRRREQVVARAEVQPSEEGQLLERAELSRHIAEAVVALAEPYRSVVILRFFEEIAPRDIARRLDIPEATVWSRLGRALEQLRRQLDTHYGDRQCWSVLIAPLSMSLASSGLSSWGSSSSGLAGSSLPLAAQTSSGFSSLLNGVLMLNKTLIVTTSVVMFALGWGTRLVTSENPHPAPASSPVLPAQDDSTETASLKAQIRQLHGEVARSRAEREALAEELEIARASTEPPTQAADPEPSAPLAVLPGKWAENEALRNADWLELGRATLEITRLLDELFRLEEKGESPAADFMQKLTKVSGQQLNFATSLMGTIPTDAPLHGEFTHPVAIGNTLSAMLEVQAHPLDRQQQEELASVIEEYDEDYSLAQLDYDDQTPVVTRLVEEFGLKQGALAKIEAFLRPEQAERVIAPRLHGRAQRDTLSPLRMLPFVRALAVSPRADLPDRFASKLREMYQIPDGDLSAQDPIVAQWVSAVTPLLEPVQAGQRDYYGAEAAAVAGRAHARIVEALLRRYPSDSAISERLRKDPRWYVPRQLAE